MNNPSKEEIKQSFESSLINELQVSHIYQIFSEKYREKNKTLATKLDILAKAELDHVGFWRKFF